MNATKITIQAVVSADRKKVWEYYTQPEHITKWNFANDDWCCPSASNDLIASIEKAIAEGKIQEGISKIQYFKDAHVLLKSGECGTNKTAFAQSSDRKCDFEIKTYEYICAGCCGNFYDEARVELIIKNYKKNIWGNWKGYQTKCYYDNVAFTVIAPIVTGFNGTSSIFYYKAITVNVGYGESDGDWETYSKWWKVGDQVQNVNIYDPKFDRVKGKASNRGLLDPNNPKWAEINCGIW